MAGHQQRGPFVLGVVGADHELTAGVELTRRGKRDGERQRRAGAQRRRERVVDEPELCAALAGAASVVMVVAEVASVPLWAFGAVRLAGLVLVVLVVMLAVAVMMMMVLAVVLVMVLAVIVVMVLAAFAAAARPVIAAAAPTAAAG